MQKILTAEEMREVDRLTTEKYGVPSIILMENAAHSVARAIAERLGGSVAGKSFLILCGRGNNGGDGAALARILATQGAKVIVYLTAKSEDSKGDARVNFQMLEQLSAALGPASHGGFAQFGNTDGYFSCGLIKDSEHWQKIVDRLMKRMDGFDCLVDALFGTGVTRPLEGFFKAIPDFYNAIYDSNKKHRRARPLLVSVDLPSGLNADLPEIIGNHIKSDLTVTFTAPKLANVLPPASNANGELVVANIGSPQELIDECPSKTFLTESRDAETWLEKTAFTSASYKNKRGHALLVAGSNDYAGAAVLAGNAAIVSGVGLVTIATARSAQNSIAARVLPEVMTRGVAETAAGAAAAEAFTEIDEFVAKSIDAVLVGSGLSSSEESTRNLVRRLVDERRTPVVLDADGLNSLSPFEIQGSDERPLVLTPHEGEFLRLLGTTDREALKDRVGVVRAFAEKHRVILVLKGERALVAAPDGRVLINPTGNSGLGKAGNGDTLAGIVTGFVAQAAQLRIDVFETVAAAVYIAGLAGDLAAEEHGKRTMRASDVRDRLTAAFRKLTTND
ncbi:MAG: NAD(P)H-hydrate dehydratase [Acidobacteria bacterium]|nr:NAD(P)H-hydrate dehydratase [Acidobacteriota bacterium]